MSIASARPLYRQIYWRLRQSISDGRLRPGDRVPSVRALASELSVAKGTIEYAYQLLISEGYLTTRGPAGTVVSPMLEQVPASGHLSLEEKPHYSLTHNGLLPLPLQIGLPALDAFPTQLWNRLASNILRYHRIETMVYPDARGLPSLRAGIVSYLGISRGIACSPEQVFIVAGYRAGLDLICRSLVTEGDQCWIEDPGYFAARDFLKEAGTSLFPVPVDNNGMIIEFGISRAPNARFAVVTPTHQSPLNVSLSMPRRQALLDWANNKKSWIIEDDYDSEYRYHGLTLPALKTIDTHGRVLYCGTFSKVLIPGLRVSYLIVPAPLISRFTEVADKMQSHCPYLWQATIAKFIEDGHFARHLKKMRKLYSMRRQMLVEALQTHLGNTVSIDDQIGGMHLVARLERDINDVVIAEKAIKRGMQVNSLSSWYLTSNVEQGLLLGFTNVISKDQANELSKNLASILNI